MVAPTDRRGFSRKDEEEGFRTWLRDTASHRGMSQADVAWAMPFRVNPKTVEMWFQGRNRPRYVELVGLCVALGELPPALRGFCPPVLVELEGSGTEPGGDRSGTGGGPGFRPIPPALQ